MGRQIRRGRRGHRVVATASALLLASAASVACTEGGDDGAAPDDRPPVTEPTPRRGPRSEPLPAVTPTPHNLSWLGPDVPVTEDVDVVVAPAVDAPTRSLVTDILASAGAEAHVTESTGGDGRGPAGGGDRLTVRIGAPGDAGVTEVLADAEVAVPDPLPAEGYALAAVRYEGDAPGAVAVAAEEPAGWFYGAQTLRQLTGGGAVAGVAAVDRPAMGLRGTIEGFYGSPWSHEERLDQLAFYGRMKLNTYVYAPKDDPYHRDRWREPYPPPELERLRELVDAAATNHVRFTFAVSPGVSICYSDPADVEALVAKLDALYGLSVRAFSLALDDIVHDRWNCPGDATAYGPPSTEAAARAQAGLLDAVQRTFVATHDDVHPLQMVPTEYRRTGDSPYRAALRADLAPEVEVMWTGRLVVPAEITVADARAAAQAFGRPPLIWDNTPVNDFPPTEGRLLLAPYDRRQPGLSGEVAGIVLNPMNQAAASKVALVGAADFTWNDAAYDPARAHLAAATLLATGDEADGDREADEATVEALLAFFDVEHLAPTSAADGSVSQPQAPALATRLDAFRSTWAAGDRSGALDALRPYAEVLAGAPARIRDRADAGFAADAAPWLDALDLWGAALLATLDGLGARAAGDAATATPRFGESASLMSRAQAVHTIEGETRPQGPVRVADGVLDAFLAEAPTLP